MSEQNEIKKVRVKRPIVELLADVESFLAECARKDALEAKVLEEKEEEEEEEEEED